MMIFRGANTTKSSLQLSILNLLPSQACGVLSQPEIPSDSGQGYDTGLAYFLGLSIGFAMNKYIQSKKVSVVNFGNQKSFKLGAYRPSPQQTDHSTYKTQRFSQKDLPIRVDLRHYMTAVEAQGEVGSCTANAMAGAYEYLAKRTLGEAGDVSRLFIYYNARALDDEVEEDEGTTILNCIKALREWGTCPESVWPYDPDCVFDEPHEEAYESALNFRLEEAERLPVDLHAMKHCLAEGFPFAFGLPLFESFMREGNKGIPVPKPDQETFIGGHAMLCVGYSEYYKVFVVRNSWGTDWGDNGYCYIPYDYLANPEFNDGDCWVVRSVSDLDFSEDVWFEEEEYDNIYDEDEEEEEYDEDEEEDEEEDDDDDEDEEEEYDDDDDDDDEYEDEEYDDDEYEDEYEYDDEDEDEDDDDEEEEYDDEDEDD
jgi:C1A family cysteine protease